MTGMLVKAHELFERAKRGEYAIAAVNALNFEIIQAALTGAEELNAPVIVQVTEDAIRNFRGLKIFLAAVRAMGEDTENLIVLHLDQVQSEELLQVWIDAGNSSVMIGTSSAPLTESIRRVRRMTEYAHARGVWVEGGLALTNAKELAKFAAKTKVDALVVGQPTIHGAFTGQEYVQLELLESIEKELPDLPLVFREASGLAAAHIALVAQTNVCKVVIDTELRAAYETAALEYLAGSAKPTAPGGLLEAAREASQRVIGEKIRLLGSAGQGTLRFI